MLVLLALADIADDEGRCYPGIKSLAAKTRLSPRAVQYNIAALVASGDLRIDAPRGSQYGTNLYVVNVSEHGETLGDAKIASRNQLREGDAKSAMVTQPIACPVTQPIACNTSVDTSDLKTSVDTSGKRTRAKRAVLTPSERQTLVDEFADLGDVGDRIDAALNHRAVDKCKNEYLYVRNWLRRERQWATERGQRSGKPAKPTPVFPGVTDAYTDAFAVSLWIVRDGKDAWLLEHQEAIAAEAKRRGLSGTEEIMDMINGVVPA